MTDKQSTRAEWAEIQRKTREGPARPMVDALDEIEKNMPVKGKPVSWPLLRAVVLGMADWQARTLQHNIAHLEKRIDGKGLEYRGVWSRASTYTRGQITTHGGCLWICSTDETTAAPGKGTDWTLAAKGG